MTARTTMALPIARLRTMTDAATDDLFNGVTFWTDDQLQDHLDAQSGPKVDLTLTASTMLVNGVTDWRTQFFNVRTREAYDYERNAQVVDASGYAINSLYFTVDWQRQMVTLTTDVTTQQAYYLRVTIFDMWDTAAEVWLEKAHQRAQYVDVKAGNHKIEFAQEYEHCLREALNYRSRRVRRFRR